LIRRLVPALLLFGSSVQAQQPPQIGRAPVVLEDKGYLLDTAEQHSIRVDIVARGLSRPFGLAFLPNGDALVTERGTRLRLIRNAAGAALAPQRVAETVSGLPEFSTLRGAGLLDVAVHPGFATNGLVYLTYNRPAAASPAGGAAPRLAMVLIRGRLEGTQLKDIEQVLQGEERVGASGSRLLFAPDDTLFVTTGAPDTREAQDLASVHGKVLRIRADGSIPADNPFVGRSGARPEVYSLGHRDQLGIALHGPSGAVVAVDHGPNGGDEANVILPGRNYGWPNYSYGRTYEGPRVSALPIGSDTEQPLLVWLPSIAPTGALFYSGSAFPAWQGNLFVGSSRRGGVPRTGGLERVVFNDRMEEMRRETLLTELHQRIRDVRQGPDGFIYVITDESDGALLRISPAP